jgi:hypothetical protein
VSKAAVGECLLFRRCQGTCDAVAGGSLESTELRWTANFRCALGGARIRVHPGITETEAFPVDQRFHRPAHRQYQAARVLMQTTPDARRPSGARAR